MALKPYNELRKVNLSKYVKERDKIPYLPWAVCVDLLHKYGAQTVYFEPLTNDKGSSLFMSDKTFKDKNGNTNNCYEVAVRIHIDDLDFVIREPLMNGSNPVKDNSLTQQRVGNAQKRAFVKVSQSGQVSDSVFGLMTHLILTIPLMTLASIHSKR